MTVELVEGRCHIPLDSGIRRNDENRVLLKSSAIQPLPHSGRRRG
jgi:hypothetical protein